MAPRKSKPQASSSLSKAQMSSSQPAAEKHPSRSMRSKRRHSESPEPSQSSQINHSQLQATPAKKRRQAKTPAAGPSEDANDDAASPGRLQELDSQVLQELEERQVQFSDELEMHNSSAEVLSAAQLSKQKLAVKRRTTISPNATGAKRFRVSSGRQSLAPEDTEMADLVPLREVLDSRVQQLMQQASPQKKADGRQVAPDLTLFDNMKVIDGRQATSTSASIRKRLSTPIVKAPSSQADSDEKDAVSNHFDAERERLQDVIVRLGLEVERQRSHIEVHRIELQSITAATDTSTYADMLKSIRESYERARKALYETIPDTENVEMTDIETLDMVVSTMKELAEQVTLAGTQFDQQEEIELELRNEVSGLLDRLAMSEVNNKRIEAQRIEAMKQVDLTKYEAGEAKDELDLVKEETGQLKLSLADRSMQLSSQEKENDRLRRSIERLKESLNDYREEDKKMQGLISRMEADHVQAITKMSSEREATVQDLEERLDAESTQRKQSALIVSQRDEQITQLEITIDELELQHASMLADIDRLRADVQREQEGRTQTEAALQLQDAQVGDLQGQVTTIGQQLEDLSGHLVQIKRAHTTEQGKLATATMELQTSQDRVKELELKVREAGLDANKLRQKMFEVQQGHQAQVAELKRAAVERDKQHKSEINQETLQRERAEQLADSHAITIKELKDDLKEVQEQMGAEIIECNTLLHESKHEMQEKIDELMDGLNATQGNLDLQLGKAREEQQQHEDVVFDLEQRISARDLQISDLNASTTERFSLLATEAEEREAAVAMLEEDVAELQLKLAAAEASNAGLERRVEDQAAQMLAYQAEKQDSIDALHEEIDDKQRKIRNIETKAMEADTRWQELLDERKQELDVLRGVDHEKTETIASLHQQVHFYREKLASYVNKVDASLRSAVDATARAHEVAQAQHDELKMESQEMLGAFEQFDGKVTVAVKHSKKTRSAKKRRTYDSGFGVASDEVDGNVVVS
ncbi:hypothetical protein AMS68_003507 [Peltaster fructicola]|uniref:Uncharacterized protein n=1 Tax=Peltaster fructicola TaxID=286661 RepID=A0A6H0XU63_9PEZI|nr:hypothetical protein AMS68_003507 [Peltaster fructicola]